MRRLSFAAALAFGLFGLALVAADEPKKSDHLSLAGDVPVDQFNDEVKDKKKGDGKPVRGGTLRVGYPSDPKSLQPLRDNDEPTLDIYSYLNDTLVNRDPQTFEYLPDLCRWWRTQDRVFLKDGKVLEGRVVSQDDAKVVFAPGAWKWTLARHELAKIDEAGGKVVWKEPFGKGEVAGAIAYWPGGRYTVFVEEKPASTVEVKTADIATVEEEAEGKKTSVQGVLREVIYEMKLRSGVKWTDGQPVRVEDYLFTYRTIMNPAVLAASTRSYMVDTFSKDPAKAVQKVSDDTIRFELRKQYFAGLKTIGGIYGAFIMPAHRYDEEKYKGDAKGFAEYWNNHPEHRATVGCGRYKLLRWERGKYLEVGRNDGWWASQPESSVPWYDPQQPYLDKIRWQFIENKNARLKALQAGDLDADFDVEQLTWEDAETKSPEFTKKFVRAQYHAPPYTYIGWNIRRPDVDEKHRFFTDKRVRLAMSHLIDQDRILKEIHYGLGVRVTGPFFEKGPYNDPDVKPVAFNPKRADALLQQAGWIDHDGDGIRDKDGVALEFTYSVHTARDYHAKIAEIVKGDLEKAGIKVNIKKTDFNAFLEVVNSRKFDVIRFAWGEPDCVDTDPFQIWHSSQWEGEGSNHTGYSNPEVDEILEKARRELDFKKRQRLFKKMHRIIAEEQPYTFLFNLYELYFYSKRCRNVRFCVIGVKPYNFGEWFIPKELQGDSK